MQHETRARFLNNATLGVHLADSNGTIVWANDTELELLGYSAEEYLGRSIAEFYIDQDVAYKILSIPTGGAELSVYPARRRAKDHSINHVLINTHAYRRNDEFVHTRCFTTSVSKAVYRLTLRLF